MRVPINPYLLLTLTMLFWSGNMVMGRWIRDDITPFTLSFCRWLIVFVLVTPLAMRHWQAQKQALFRGYRAVLWLGAFGIFGYNTCAYMALRYTTAANTTLLNSFIPIVTMFITWAFLGKKLNRLQGAGVLLSLLGVFLVISRGEVRTLLALDINQGDIWMLVAVCIWALYTVGLSFRPDGVDPFLLLMAMTGVGLIMLFPLFCYEQIWVHPLRLDSKSSLAILYIGIFPGFVGQYFYNQGVREVGANQASLFIHLMPVFGSLLSYVFLGEGLAWYHYLGMALIFGGIGLSLNRAWRALAVSTTHGKQ